MLLALQNATWISPRAKPAEGLQRLPDEAILKNLTAQGDGGWGMLATGSTEIQLTATRGCPPRLKFRVLWLNSEQRPFLDGPHGVTDSGEGCAGGSSSGRRAAGRDRGRPCQREAEQVGLGRRAPEHPSPLPHGSARAPAGVGRMLFATKRERRRTEPGCCVKHQRRNPPPAAPTSCGSSVSHF